MMEQVDQLPRECCRDQANRSEPERVTDDLSMERCQVCGARHFILTVDPVVLFSEGTEV